MVQTLAARFMHALEFLALRGNDRRTHSSTPEILRIDRRNALGPADVDLGKNAGHAAPVGRLQHGHNIAKRRRESWWRSVRLSRPLRRRWLDRAARART